MRTVSRKPRKIASCQRVGRDANLQHRAQPVATWAGPQYKLPQMPASPENHRLLESIHAPADLRSLPTTKLAELAEELRRFLIHSVSTRGGHFAAGLGTVELTIALHYVFNTPYDRLVWDVGHQAYPHKVLTGRRDRLHTIKQHQGLAPFPTRTESEYDTFGVGHSSTSLRPPLPIPVPPPQPR